MKIIKVSNITLYLLFILFLCGYIRVGLTIFFIVVFHELGHILVCLLFGYKIKSVTIYPFGGITNLEKDINTSPCKEMILASAGLFMQIVLYVIFLVVGCDNYIFYKYNKSIFLFNLLPIIPLDGSIIVYSLLNKFTTFKNSYRGYIIISVISLVIYIFINYKYSLNNYLIISIFIYKIYDGIKNYKYVYNRFLLERYLKKYSFRYISTREGNLDILKIDTYQYFKNGGKIVSEREKLAEIFDKH